MTKGERALRKINPDRESFSAEEIAFADRLLSAFFDAPSRVPSLPVRFVPIGERVTVAGFTYECIEADRVSVPCFACQGCDLSKKYRPCGDLQCSAIDREDRTFVWFKEVEE